MLIYIWISVTFIEGKVGKEISYLECHLWWWSIKSGYHTYCKTRACRERTCDLQLGDLGYNSSSALTNFVILEQYFFWTLKINFLWTIFIISNMGKIIPIYLRGSGGTNVLYCTVMYYKKCFHYYFIFEFRHEN